MIDPRTRPDEYVAEPMRAALDGIVLRGVIGFTLATMAVLAAALPMADDGLETLVHHLLPALLAAYVLARVLAGWRHRPDPDAWQRARELQAAGSGLARLLSIVVPLGVLFAGAALLGPHAIRADDRLEVLYVFGPAFLFLWFVATLAWSDQCRDLITRAARDSEARFRAYWAHVAGR